MPETVADLKLNWLLILRGVANHVSPFLCLRILTVGIRSSAAFYRLCGEIVSWICLVSFHRATCSLESGWTTKLLSRLIIHFQWNLAIFVSCATGNTQRKSFETRMKINNTLSQRRYYDVLCVVVAFCWSCEILTVILSGQRSHPKDCREI